MEQRRARFTRRRSSLFARGEPMVWLTGGALALCLAMIAGLLLLVVAKGMSSFWPGAVVRVETTGGKVFAGEVTRDEVYRPGAAAFGVVPEARRARAEEMVRNTGGEAHRELLRTGNFELTNTHFQWVSDFEIESTSRPDWALVVERLTWGRFYGVPKAFLKDGNPLATEPEEIWKLFESHHPSARERWRLQRKLETDAIGEVSREVERARLERRRAELASGRDSEAWREADRAYVKTKARTAIAFKELRVRIDAIKKENARLQLVLETAQGKDRHLELAEIVRAYPANRLSWAGRLGVYLSRWWEFLLAEPREANSEGGVYPAIFGTVVMTLLMALLVVPFGVLAALYLREYAKQGVLVSIVRIAVNNLAGVPSIVFGVFGLGLLCYIVGSSVDDLFFSASLPNPTYGKGGILWASLTLALLTLPVVIVATEEALAAVPNSMREGSYACGAGKWQTIRRIVLPRAMPGIMTGMILAIARGAGEVAPLMLVGAVKLAPKLPVDGAFPYIHPERSFMHLGFHVYDLGFQSQNSEAAKPMVFTTTLVLIGIVMALNGIAILVRSRLRKAQLGG